MVLPSIAAVPLLQRFRCDTVVLDIESIGKQIEIQTPVAHLGSWLRAKGVPRNYLKGYMMWDSTWDVSTNTLPWTVVLIVSLIAVVTDLHSRRIPNLLTGPVFLAGLMWSTVTSGWGGLAESVLASAILMTPFVLLFVFAAGGAGDAKLMAALGAWLGLLNGLVVLFCVSLAGVACALVLSASSGRLQIVLQNVRRMMGSVTIALLVTKDLRSTSGLMTSPDEMRTMPYGISVFIGVCAAAGGMHLWHA